MVSRAFSETSGKIWSRTSPRAGEGAAAFDSFADGGASVCREAGGELRRAPTRLERTAAGIVPPNSSPGRSSRNSVMRVLEAAFRDAQAFRLVLAEKRAARMPMSWMKKIRGDG